MKHIFTHPKMRTGSIIFLCAFFVGFFITNIISVKAFVMPTDDNYYITESGGDCIKFGMWDEDTKTCTLSRDDIQNLIINTDNVTIDGAGHTTHSNISVSTYSGTTIKNLTLNTISVYNSPSTVIHDNTFPMSGGGVIVLSNPQNIQIFHNNFLGTGGISSSHIVLGSINSSRVTVSQPLPIGGNYYAQPTDYTCVDADADKICDQAFTMQSLIDGGGDDLIPTVAIDQFPWAVQDGWKSSIPSVPGYSSVLFLPALEASRLYEQRTSCTFGIDCEDQLWEPNANSDGAELNMNVSGGSIKTGIYTRDIIQETNTPIYTGAIGENIYKSFSALMDSLVTAQSPKKMAAWKAYAYDWRYSVDDIVNNGTTYQTGQVSLIQTLQTLVASSTTGKVTVIAHSNGGLLAKALLIKLQAMKTAGTSDLIDHIDNLILVASPQIGTASAVPAMLHGFDEEIFGRWILSQSTARELAKNMPGAFGLLPSKKYINQISASPVAFVDNAIPSGVTTGLINAYGTVIDSYPEYKSFLFGAEGRTQPAAVDTISPGILSASLFAKAETLHNSLDNWTPPASIHVVQIAGWGIDTVASFQYYPKYVCDSSSSGVGQCKYVLDERPIFTADGDKKVVSPSALWMTGEKYYVDVHKYNHDISGFPKKEHKNILEISPLLNFISNIIQGISPTSSIYLSTTTPIDTSNRLRLSVLSPVTLDAYDAAGNHTGKVCPPTSDLCYVDEDISNSGYYEFGEGKYLNLPEDTAQRVELQGTDVGTFTFNFQTVTPSGQSTTQSFVDVPVTTQTQAEITVPANTQTPQLALDVTGDGVTDFTLAPTTVFDPVAYLQIMKATIDSLDITQTKKDNFDRRIDNTIKAIQKGKIDKAKLKADNFKKALENKLSKPDPKKPKPKKLSKTDAQTLLDMLNTLLDNLN